MINSVISDEVISIKVLKVNSRKMTFAVFNQLKNISIFNEEMELNGIPWGIVNYFKKNPQASDSIHLVWSDGSELFRCILSPLRTSAETAFKSYTGEHVWRDVEHPLSNIQ